MIVLPDRIVYDNYVYKAAERTLFTNNVYFEKKKISWLDIFRYNTYNTHVVYKKTRQRVSLMVYDNTLTLPYFTSSITQLEKIKDSITIDYITINSPIFSKTAQELFEKNIFDNVKMDVHHTIDDTIFSCTTNIGIFELYFNVYEFDTILFLTTNITLSVEIFSYLINRKIIDVHNFELDDELCVYTYSSNKYGKYAKLTIPYDDVVKMLRSA